MNEYEEGFVRLVEAALEVVLEHRAARGEPSPSTVVLDVPATLAKFNEEPGELTAGHVRSAFSRLGGDTRFAPTWREGDGSREIVCEENVCRIDAGTLLLRVHVREGTRADDPGEYRVSVGLKYNSRGVDREGHAIFFNRVDDGWRVVHHEVLRVS